MVKKNEDPRNPNKITYPIEVLLWIGICLFLFKLESCRQIHFKLSTENFISNLNGWLKSQIKNIPHADTIKYFLCKLPIHVLSKLRLKMIRTLLRQKCFVNFRLLGIYYLIAIDFTRILKFSYPHCPYCLTQTLSNGKIIYYHGVLEAKLILANGMVISLCSEFVENSNSTDRQDCELNAFYRLLKQLKKDFPQLRICLILDSLYLNQQTFSICKENNWAYIITFKESSLPSVAEEFYSLLHLQPENSANYNHKGNLQQYRWVSEIDYKGHLVNVLECKESKKDSIKRFVWITNLSITKDNFYSIANEGGRLRWKIENEGFNTQKNGGYALEHTFCKEPLAIKNFYLLLQIAHLINQLLELGTLGKKEIKNKFGSIKNISSFLLAELQHTLIDFVNLEKELSFKFQIRFYYDTS